MAFDIGAVLGDMASAAGDVLAGEGPKVNSCIKAAIEEGKDALEAIAKARLDEEIDDADMKSQITDEKESLTAALLACEGKSKMAVQKAATASTKEFIAGVKAALKAAE